MDTSLIERIKCLEDKLKLRITEIQELLSHKSDYMLFLNTHEERDNVMNFLSNLEKKNLLNILDSDDCLQKIFGFSADKAKAYVFDYVCNDSSKVEPVKTLSENISTPQKKTFKIKKEEPVKSRAILIWNSFLNIVKLEMEANNEVVKYDDVVAKAKEMKDSDPSSYKLFSENWTPDHSTNLS